MPQKKTPTVKTAEKALFILDVIGNERKPLTASEISAIADMPISTVYKILSTLVETEYADFIPQTKQYQLGTKVLKFATNLKEQHSISQLAYPIMQRLAEITKETVHLGIPEGYYGVFLEKVNSPQTVGVQTRVGTRIPLNVGATSKAMMAFISDDAFSDFCNGFLKDGTEAGEEKIKDAVKQREQIRKDGYSVTFEEVNNNVAAVSAPVLGLGGKLLGSMAIAGIRDRFPEERIAEYISLITEACKELSLKMGFCS